MRYIISIVLVTVSAVGGCGNVNPGSICDEGVHEIHDADDLEALKHCTTLSGSLIIEETEITSISLPNLISVGNVLWIKNNDDLTDLDMGSLTSVGLSLWIGSNESLEDTYQPITLAANRRALPRSKRFWTSTSPMAPL